MWAKFAVSGLGGASGWMFVHPFDLIKVRLQLSGEGGGQKMYTSSADCARKILQQEGVKGFYGGLSAALTRQLTYTTMRLGLYDVIKEKTGFGGSMREKMFVGVVAGGVTGIVCCPVEVALIRMQADGRLPVDQRRGYKHVFDAFFRMFKEEGVAVGWRGAVPTVTRGAVVSMTQLASYDQAKTSILKAGLMKNGIALHTTASLIAGVVYCWASLPFDIAKTRMQNQQPVNGQLPYRNIFHTMGKILTTEGPLSLWKGFLPYFARGGGHTVGMFIFVEQYKTMVDKFYGVSK